MADCDLAELRDELQISERTFAFGSVVDPTLAVRKLPLDPGGRVRSENRNLNRSTFGAGEQVSFFRSRFHEGGKSIAEGMASLYVAEVERVGGNQLPILADRLGAVLHVPAAGDGDQQIRRIFERDLCNGESSPARRAQFGDGKVSVVLDNGPFRNSGDFRDFRDKLLWRGHMVLDADADQPLPQFSNAQNGKEIDRPPLLSIVQNANDSEEGETMTELSKTEIATALVLGLTAMDNPPNRKWDEQRSEEDRDAARRLSAHILATVPDMAELATICVGIWIQQTPQVMKENRDFYHGPDIFRENEHYQYPDDSGWTEENDVDTPTWAERAGQKELQEVFNDKAVLELHRLHERHKRQKAEAAQEKRRAKAAEKRAAEQRDIRQRQVVAQMMRSATAPSSGLMH